MSFAAAPLGDVERHLLPATSSGPAVLAGVLTFLFLEKLLRHEHGPCAAAHTHTRVTTQR